MRLLPNYNELTDYIVSRTPARRLATPEDLAGIVAFLCSPEADWIRGQTIVADGGFHPRLVGTAYGYSLWIGSKTRSLCQGASRGIGKAVALELPAKAPAVVVNYKDRKDDAEAVVEQINGGGGKAFAFKPT